MAAAAASAVGVRGGGVRWAASASITSAVSGCVQRGASESDGVAGGHMLCARAGEAK